MSELNTKRALDYALKELEIMADGVGDNLPNPIAIQTLRTVNCILNPPEEFEEMEECAGWASVNLNRETGMPVIGAIYLPEDKNKIPDHPDRMTVQEIRVKVKRPVKRPVVREVEFPCSIERHSGGIRASFNILVSGNNSEEHAALRDSLEGKTGTLIFRWTD